MAERDERAAIDFLQPVLQVGYDGHRHEQRSVNFEQRRALDCLHVPPEMSIVISQIAIPTATRPCLDHHRHRHAADARVVWSHFLEQRLERHVERRLNADLLGEIQGEIVECGNSHSIPPL